MPKEHTIVVGECISSLAYEEGFFPETIWNDPANAELKQLREDMNVLSPGDVVTIPDKRDRSQAVETGREHRFKLRGMPVKFLLKLTDGDEPMAGVWYKLKIDGKIITGITGEDGMIDQWIPANAKRGLLTVEGGEEYPFQLGHLQPVAEEEGVRDRLQNLGMLQNGADDAAYRAAVEAFKKEHCRPTDASASRASASPEGMLSEDEQERLIDVHGS